MALAFVWLVKRMQRDQSKAIDDMDVSNISLQDYSVKVDDVPKTATPAEIGTFFSKFGKVHQVTLGTDVGKLIGKHRKRSEMVFQREELHAAVCKSRGKSIVAKEQLRNHERPGEARGVVAGGAAIERHWVSHLGVRGVRDRGQPAGVRGKMQPDNTLAWLFRRKKYRFRGTHRLWIHRARRGHPLGEPRRQRRARARRFFRGCS